MGASTPEELETLLEDAFLQHDATAITELFDEDGLLLTSPDFPMPGGPASVFHTASALCGRPFHYVAGPCHIWQAGDTALLLGAQSVSVVQRGRDGCWRYLITHLNSPSRPVTGAS